MKKNERRRKEIRMSIVGRCGMGECFRSFIHVRVILILQYVLTVSYSTFRSISRPESPADRAEETLGSRLRMEMVDFPKNTRL